jgi:hypothetical protein
MARGSGAHCMETLKYSLAIIPFRQKATVTSLLFIFNVVLLLAILLSVYFLIRSTPLSILFFFLSFRSLLRFLFSSSPPISLAVSPLSPSPPPLPILPSYCSSILLLLPSITPSLLNLLLLFFLSLSYFSPSSHSFPLFPILSQFLLLHIPLFLTQFSLFPYPLILFTLPDTYNSVYRILSVRSKVGNRNLLMNRVYSSKKLMLSSCEICPQNK